MHHDVITLGASAGGLDVLLEAIAELPPDFPASLFVAMHVQADRVSLVPQILNQRGSLPASHPLHGEKIERGRIYVAPPDSHLLLRRGHMEVVRGPKENGHRPSIDALFRSAATAFGSRVIGVVLSGYRDCGTAGLMSIKARGGIGVVQAPESARVPDMPRSAIERASADHVIRPDKLGQLLVKLVESDAGETTDPDDPVRQLEGDLEGAPAELACPLCHGALVEASSGDLQYFRCHVGHIFSLEALANEQREEMERALWAAVRALEDGAAVNRRLATRSRGRLHRTFAEKASTQAHQAETVRKLLLQGGTFTSSDSDPTEP